MNKQLLTGMTIVGVAASAGVAYEAVSAIHSASAESAPASSAPVQPVSRTIVYQVGAAGQVTVNVAGGTLTVNGSAATTGWSVVAASATGAHAEVQFTDGVQLVTFTADLVGDNVAVSVTNTEAPGATTVAGQPINVVVISDSNTPTPTPAPTPAATSPAAPGSTSAPTSTTTAHSTTTTTKPAPAATTAPSSAGGQHNGGEHESGEHESGEDD
jgi:hypothetical protein